MSPTFHRKYNYFHPTVQTAEDKMQLKFYFCRLPFVVNVMLNLPIVTSPGTSARLAIGENVSAYKKEDSGWYLRNTVVVQQTITRHCHLHV